MKTVITNSGFESCSFSILSFVYSARMKFPVDLLADIGPTEMEKLAHNYIKNLLLSNPDYPERLTLSDSTEV